MTIDEDWELADSPLDVKLERKQLLFVIGEKAELVLLKRELEIFKLYFIENKTYSHIATSLGESATNVWRKLRRGLYKIRESLLTKDQNASVSLKTLERDRIKKQQEFLIKNFYR